MKRRKKIKIKNEKAHVEVMKLVINMALRAPVSPRAHGMAPERAASALRVAFALQVLHGSLLLLAPRRPRL